MVEVVVVVVVVVDVVAIVVVDGRVANVDVTRVVDVDNVGRVFMAGGRALLACPFTDGLIGLRIGPGRFISSPEYKHKISYQFNKMQNKY